MSLPPLFGALSRLRCLDLAHSGPQAFRFYCEWVHDRAISGQAALFRDLRVLRLPRVDLWMVVGLVNIVAESLSPHDSRVGIQQLRVERVSDVGRMLDAAEWIRCMVPDFCFTDLYLEPLVTYSLV